jgi:TRAP-type transport system periplasmic protein
MKTLLTRVAAGLLLCGLAAPVLAQDKIFTMKLGTLTVNDEAHEYLKQFAAAVEKDTKGRVKAEIFPSGQLGSAAREIEGTQFGSMQGFIGPPDFFAGIDERFEVASAPGTFRDIQHAQAVADDAEFHKAFMALGANKGLVGVAMFVNAPVTMLTRTPARHLADFKGLKIRVLASDFQNEQVKRLGGTPVAMSLGDVLPALQQGAIDGALASVPAFTPLHFYDAAKYMTETGQYVVFIVLEMSKKWLDTMPPDLRKIVVDDGDRLGREVLPWNIKEIAKQAADWKAHGGELLQLPADEQAEMMKSMSTIGDDVAARRPGIKDMYELLKAAAKRHS